MIAFLLSFDFFSEEEERDYDGIGEKFSNPYVVSLHLLIHYIYALSICDKRGD
jgi:hypothetical protein